jgi:hypothetical protein
MHLFKSSFVYNQGEQCNTEFNREEFQNNAVIIECDGCYPSAEGQMENVWRIM